MPLPTDGDSSESSVYDGPSSFDPYDPESVQPTSPGPAQSSSAPGFGDTSGADGEQQSSTAPQGQPDPEPALPEFDPKHREAFEGLLYLGRLQDTFSLWGHTFVVRTLTTEQLAEIGLLVKPYQGSAVENAVYQSAVVAASVVTVDGKALPSAITIDDSDTLGAVRFPYVMRNWMPPVREAVYNKCLALEYLVREVLTSMGKASG